VNEWKIPGMSVGVIEDGKVELLRGYGVSEAGGAPLTEKSVFQIGSVSKSFYCHHYGSAGRRREG